MNSLKRWVVEIQVRDAAPVPAGGVRTVSYETVSGGHDIAARKQGFEQFASHTKTQPGLAKRMAMLGLRVTDCCAARAVQIG